MLEKSQHSYMESHGKRDNRSVTEKILCMWDSPSSVTRLYSEKAPRDGEKPCLRLWIVPVR